MCHLEEIWMLCLINRGDADAVQFITEEGKNTTIQFRNTKSTFLSNTTACLRTDEDITGTRQHQPRKTPLKWPESQYHIKKSVLNSHDILWFMTWISIHILYWIQSNCARPWWPWFCPVNTNGQEYSENYPLGQREQRYIHSPTASLNAEAVRSYTYTEPKIAWEQANTVA